VASANLDLVRSIYADWERGDYSRADWADPDIEFVLADGPDPGTWSGLKGMWEGWRERLSIWADHRMEVDEFREVGNDRVLVLAHAVARGQASGMEVRSTPGLGASVFHVRDGRVAKLLVYWDRAHALADLGLAPESA
jgi:ketosteroid isomerase-like protein